MMGSKDQIVPLDAYAHLHANDKRGIKKAKKMWRRKLKRRPV